MINVIIISVNILLLIFIKWISNKLEMINVVRLSLCLWGRLSGVDLMMLCSLLNVIIELVKVMVLIKILRNILIKWIICFVWVVVLGVLM